MRQLLSLAEMAPVADFLLGGMESKTMRSFKAYHTVTGRSLDLTELAGKERSLLGEVLERYQHKPEWSKFARFWLKAFQSFGLEESSVVRRVCEDLEARLGIAQGKVAAPDYRDYLVGLIEEKYGTRYRFCREHGLDQGHLSRVLTGKGDFSMDLLRKLLSLLNADFVVKPNEELAESRSVEDASRELASVLGTS